ncbi:ATP-dependent RNA helicase RhlE [Anaerohalosphaera lusitana]|uniref:DEAD-box ATP-dependent RNA helicase RhpA n=1 Tax=Anaerohalosphaera lusitana TaxID=1936003 RepID=A0A1U9NHU5_9BACT|nr:DEAD/DEAH box helicase [Anaerohalosphaera lusitana]AQT67512.1 ATP-dependent RNA helicase RhlE [Anaerohalosphaera lusitana]
MPFKKIGLCDELVQGILATGYTAPTEIQAEAIPVAIEGRDMIGCAQTGTGKTAAFVLPILNKIAKIGHTGGKPRVKALIVTPTRELAMQIDNSVKGYGRFVKMKSAAIFGGASMEKQVKALRRGVDVIAATPGRLIDHVGRGTVDLSGVEVLVLDEADRMLDMGFVNDIQKIIERMPKKRQTLLFSATMSKEVKKLTKTIQRSPKMIQIGEQHNPIDTITQHIYPVPAKQKMDLLRHMLERHQMYSVLIFSRTKRGADRICKNLKKAKVKAVAIHSDRTQRQRLQALDGFKRGKFQVMVATDIAARGINVEGISHVFNYDVPAYAEDYVHRIGRTGRAEATGDAITFVGYDEIPNLKKIERFIGRTFAADYYDDFEYETRISLNDGPKKSSGRKKGGSRGRGGNAKSGRGGGANRGGGRGRSKDGGAAKRGASGGGKAKSAGGAGRKRSESSESRGGKKNAAVKKAGRRDKGEGSKSDGGKVYFGGGKGKKKRRGGDDASAKSGGKKRNSKSKRKKRSGGKNESAGDGKTAAKRGGVVRRKKA